MPLDPEVRRPAPARGSVALDKGGSGENEGEAHVSAVWAKVQAAVQVQGQRASRVVALHSCQADITQNCTVSMFLTIIYIDLSKITLKLVFTEL